MISDEVIQEDQYIIEAQYILCHPDMLVTQKNLRAIIAALLCEALSLREAIRLTHGSCPQCNPCRHCDGGDRNDKFFGYDEPESVPDRNREDAYS